MVGPSLGHPLMGQCVGCVRERLVHSKCSGKVVILPPQKAEV